MPQDCMDHLRLAHAVPSSVKLPTWENGFHRGLSRQTWSDALNPRISGVSTDVLLFSECGAPLVHTACKGDIAYLPAWELSN